jgi:magnesium transporter
MPARDRHDGAVIIDCAVYRSGARLDAPPGKLDLAATVERLQDGDFVWLGVHEPDAGELATVADALKLHPLAVEDAVKAHQRPKVEKYDDATFIVVKTLTYEDRLDAVETGEVATFLGQHYIVTVRHGQGATLGPARRRAEVDQAQLGHGPHSAFYAILDEVVDGYAEVAAALEQDVSEVEASVFSTERTQDSERIYRLKRELLEVRRAVAPLRDPLVRFLHSDAELATNEAVPFFRDVVDHLMRVAETVDTLDSLLDSALSAHLARLSIQQNDDTRKISAVAALFLAPTLIAGVYGMNFEHMPELAWKYGYGFALLLMVGVSYGLYRAFKSSGWL